MSTVTTNKPFTPRESELLRRYFNDIRKFKKMTKSQIIACYTRYGVSGDIRELYPFINSNLRYVVTVAKKFLNKGLDIMELIAEGNLGLVKAAERYDLKRGSAFTTFARFYINEAIMYALTYKSRTVRISEDIVDTSNNISKFVDDFIQMYGYEPSDEEIAEHLDMKEKKVKSVRIHNLKTISVNKPIGFECDSDEVMTLGDVISDTMVDADYEGADSKMEREELLNAVMEVLDTFDSKERTVIRSFYGLGCDVMTAKEIAARMGVSADYVGQIRRGAEAKLRLKIA